MLRDLRNKDFSHARRGNLLLQGNKDVKDERHGKPKIGKIEHLEIKESGKKDGNSRSGELKTWGCQM